MAATVALSDVLAAAERIAPHVHRTPVMTSATLDRIVGARLFFKCENLQKVGAFKARGATNAVLSRGASDARPVATHSSGNHAAALAYAARIRGVRAHIVMPENAPAVKRAAVEGYGGAIVWCAPTLAAREETLARVVGETGAEFVHPYEDPRVVAGQGTAARELIEDVEGLDVVIAPIGGGGLLSGTAIATNGLSARTRIWGCEPAVADDAARSFRSGKREPANDPVTVADGLRTQIGELAFEVLRTRIDEVVCVPEDEIVAAMRLVWERMKIVIEPSSAVAVAAVIARRAGLSGKRVGVVLTGGNVDLERVRW